MSEACAPRDGTSGNKKNSSQCEAHESWKPSEGKQDEIVTQHQDAR